MVTLEQMQTGLGQYIDTELLPHLSGIKKVGLAAYSVLAVQNFAEMVRKYQNHPAVSVMNVINGAGEVDIDKLYTVFEPLFAEKQKINIPLIGEFTLDHSDLETLYRYIKG